jgi:hypothetical protein
MGMLLAQTKLLINWVKILQAAAMLQCNVHQNGIKSPLFWHFLHCIIEPFIINFEHKTKSYGKYIIAKR